MSPVGTLESPANTALRRKLSQFDGFDAVLLIVLLAVVPLLYYPSALHNLPVPTQMDEQVSLNVLQHFRTGGMNPDFFMYPTLYYYLTYPFVAFVRPTHMLFAARLVNFAIFSAAAFISYGFCKRHLGSRVAGVIAAFCVVTSVLISSSGSYLCTDVLLACTSTATLYFLVSYFETHQRGSWIAAMIALGTAVGCKYTAFLLFIAYGITELLQLLFQPRAEAQALASEHGTIADSRFSYNTILTILGGGAVALFALAYFFPTQSMLHLVLNVRSNPNPKPEAFYLGFFQHVRHSLAKLGVVFLLLAAATRTVPVLYRFIALKRLYLGLAIVVGVFLLTTPYSLVTPRHFLFDLGALFRSNIVVDTSGAGHQQWGQYASWLFRNENLLLVLAGFTGWVLLAVHKHWKLTIVAVYLLLYTVVICVAPAGYWRYLTPVLPMLYCGTGIALMWLWNARAQAVPHLPKIAFVAIVATASLSISRHILEIRNADRSTDSWFASYRTASLNTSGTVYYAGYTPWVPLWIDGLKIQQVSWADLAGRNIGNHLECGDVVIIQRDLAAGNHVDVATDPTVTLLLDDPRGYGQQVLRRTDCNSAARVQDENAHSAARLGRP